MSYSSGIVKPDGVRRGLVREIFQKMEAAGLKVVFEKSLSLNKEDIRVLYEYCYGLPHYQSLEGFMMSGQVVFYVVSSKNGDAIEMLNKLVGPTNPQGAPKETLRGFYGEDIARNVVHSTQDRNTLRKDLIHFMTKEELVEILL